MGSPTWQPHVVRICMVPELDGTPASVHPSSGTMFVSTRWWNAAPFSERLFVLLHECGHLETQSRSEFDADAWAFRTYANEGHSLKGAIDALRHFLPFTNQEQLDRATVLLNQAIQFDNSPKG